MQPAVVVGGDEREIVGEHRPAALRRRVGQRRLAGAGVADRDAPPGRRRGSMRRAATWRPSSASASANTCWTLRRKADARSNVGSGRGVEAGSAVGGSSDGPPTRMSLPSACADDARSASARRAVAAQPDVDPGVRQIRRSLGKLGRTSIETQREICGVRGRFGATGEQRFDRRPSPIVVGRQVDVATGQLDDSTHAVSTILRGGPTCPMAPHHPTRSPACCAAAPRSGTLWIDTIGSSMGRAIPDGARVRVVAVARPRRGEVWAMCSDDGRVIVHRVLGVVDGRWWLQGDANRSPDRPVELERLIGRVDEIDVAGRRRRLGAFDSADRPLEARRWRRRGSGCRAPSRPVGASVGARAR